MLTVRTCCGCFSLKTGSYVAAVLFMIYALFGIIGGGLSIGYATSELDIINNSIDVFACTGYLIFSIMVIMAVRKEKIKTIQLFVLLLLFLFVRRCIYLFYVTVYFFFGYNYNIFQIFLLTPSFICLNAFCLVIAYSYYRQLKTAQRTVNTNDVPDMNEKRQIP